MDNRDAFKNFIEKDGILYGTEPYAKDTKSTYLQRMDLFIEESKIDIYAINDTMEIQKILKEKKDFIFNLSKSNMKRVLDWYIEFLLMQKNEYKSADEIANHENYSEGSTKIIYVNAYERNSKARQKCLEEYGYKCSVCNFDFEDIYGSIGKKFIHVHHLIPLSEIGEEYQVNSITDLRPVCPNCHAMLYKGNPYSIEELQKIIKN